MNRPTAPGRPPAPQASFEELLQRGVAALLAGDARGAAAALTEAIEHRPFDPIAHFDLAVACRLRGQLPLALGHARLAAQLSGSARAHVLYGLHLQLAGARGRAQPCFERALALEPGYRLAAMYLALAHREQGRRADAIAGLERALAPGPGALPALVAERVRGQLFDLRRDQGPDGAVATALCSVAAVTEILLPDGAAVHLEPDAAAGPTASPSPARACSADEVAGYIHRASRVVALTGAGASAASGLATRKQLWRRFDRDAAVSAVGFARDPSVLWTVVRGFLGPDDHPPNAAHLALARIPRLSAIVTQNVDGLHQRAAPEARATPVFELHGTLDRMLCGACGAGAPQPARHYVREHPAPPRCASCGGALRPDVVLFGEQVPVRTLAESLRAVEACDLLLVVGCAMDVAPASELPRIAAARGARVVELKLSPSRISDAIGSELLLGPAEETLPAIYARLGELEPLDPLPAPPPPRPPGALAAAITLPALGEGITEARLLRWLRKVGDEIAPGEVIAEFENDKIDVEIDAPVGGVVRALRFEPEAFVPIGAAIADVEPVAPPAPRAPVDVREPSLPLFADFGPHAAAVRRGLVALDEARWLSPEGPRDALEAHVRELADAHRRALDPAAAPVEVWLTDERDEALARWRRDWQPTATGVRPFDAATSAWRDALAAARRRTASDALSASKQLQALVRGRVAWRMTRLFGRGRPEGYARAELAIERPVFYHLAGLAARGQDRDPPCPFAPVAAIWAAGLWPFALPGGVLGVYLPRPGALAASQQRSRAVAVGALPDFVGLSSPPPG